MFELFVFKLIISKFVDPVNPYKSEHPYKSSPEDKALKIHERAYMINKADIQRKLKQGCYPSEIVLAMVVEYLQKHYNSEDEIRSTRQFCRKLLTKINDDTLEVANAE